MHRSLKKILVFLVIGISGGAALFAGILNISKWLIFFPSAEIAATPSVLGLPYENVRFQTSDHETLAGWFIPATTTGKEPGAGLTLLFFHGNAGNISHRLESIEIFNKLGLDVLIIDYRGYGQSTGKSSVEGTILDAEAAWHWLTTEKGLAPDQIIIFGRSLGGGVAAALAGRVQARALILESTFTSLHDVGKEMFPWAPVGLFLQQDFDSPAALAKMHAPLLVVHSPDDEVVNFRFGKSLFDGYDGPKQFLQLAGSHNSGFLEHRTQYIRGLASFLNTLW